MKYIVYTPTDTKEKVELFLNTLNIDYRVNDINVKVNTSDLILHYKSKLLEDSVKDKLLKHIEYGNIVMPLVDFLDNSFGYCEIDLLNSDYFLHHKSFGVLRSKSRKVIKRVGSLVNATLLGLISFPIMLLTALFIKLESKGPLFYKQKRVGLYNKEFEVIKFRSMSVDAEKKGAQWASKNDARVTKVGSFIRKTRIDELPQIINMFKGEMNLIGPRPEREVFIKDLEKELPYYRFRHSVKPGITGYAQVKYAYGASVEDAKWKHRYDIYYIKYQTIWFDIKIIFMTVRTVLFGMGR